MMFDCTNHPNRSLLLQPILLALSILSISCDSNIQKPSPPPNQLYYPLGLAPHPEGRFLYVNNAVFDRKYNEGYIVAVDTFEKKILEKSVVKTGLFAGQLRTTLSPNKPMLYTPIRDRKHIISLEIEVDPHTINQAEEANQSKHLFCEQDQKSYCQQPYLAETAGSLPMPKDPYDIHISDAFMYVSHIQKGELSVWRLEPDPSGAYLPVFDCQTRLTGNINYVIKHPKANLLYATDRFGLSLHRIEIKRQPSGKCQLIQLTDVLIDASAIGAETRGMALSADASRLYVASGVDRTIRVYDISLDNLGNPQTLYLYAMPTGLSPNQITVVGKHQNEVRYTSKPISQYVPLNPPIIDQYIDDFNLNDLSLVDTDMAIPDMAIPDMAIPDMAIPDTNTHSDQPAQLGQGYSTEIQDLIDLKGEGLLLVSSFDEGNVFVLNPLTRRIIAKIKVGLGAHEIVVLPDQDHQLRAYVTNFQVHSISIIDLEPNSPTRFKEIGRIPEAIEP